MASFLFQPDPIDGVKFKPIKIDIDQGVIKIVDDEIFYDFQINTTESVIVGTAREEVLERIQRGFENKSSYILSILSICFCRSNIRDSSKWQQ